MIKNLGKYIKFLGYPVSILFLYFTFKDLDFKNIFDNLKYINVGYFILAIILNFGFFYLRGLYQKNNLKFLKDDINNYNSLAAFSKGQFFNTFLPARIGDIVRIAYLSDKEGINKAKLLPYIILEKIIDMVLFVILLFFISLGITFSEKSTVDRILLTSAGLIGSAVIGMILYLKYDIYLFKILEKRIPQKIYIKLSGLNQDIKDGLHLFRSWKQVLFSGFLFLTSWSLVLINFYIVIMPFLDILHLPASSAIVFMTFSALSLVIPSAPGAIGTMHFAFLLGIQMLTHDQFDKNIAAGFIIFLHFFIIGFDFVVGAFMTLYDTIQSRKHKKTPGGIYEKNEN